MISLLVVITLSILVTRVATVALTHNGLSKEVSRFQARSAFSGVGYTTREAEQLVNHPVRHRLLLLLMLMGNAGIVTAASRLILHCSDSGTLASYLHDPPLDPK
jgi:Trk-type K+ transport system membrane component